MQEIVKKTEDVFQRCTPPPSQNSTPALTRIQSEAGGPGSQLCRWIRTSGSLETDVFQVLSWQIYSVCQLCRLNKSVWRLLPVKHQSHWNACLPSREEFQREAISETGQWQEETNMGKGKQILGGRWLKGSYVQTNPGWAVWITEKKCCLSQARQRKCVIWKCHFTKTLFDHNTKTPFHHNSLHQNSISP